MVTLLAEETGVSGENHRPAANHWKTLCHKVASIYSSLWTGIELTTVVVIGTDCTGSCKSNYHTITTTTTSQRNMAISCTNTKRGDILHHTQNTPFNFDGQSTYKITIQMKRLSKRKAKIPINEFYASRRANNFHHILQNNLNKTKVKIFKHLSLKWMIFWGTSRCANIYFFAIFNWNINMTN